VPSIDKDVKAVLLGHTVLLDDGRLMNCAPGEFNMFSGVGDGAGSVRIFGVARRARAFDTKLSEKKAIEAARISMAEIGRGVLLQSNPNLPACLIRYILTKPVVITFGYMDGRPVAIAYAGRGISTLISIKRALAAFTDELPDSMKVSDVKIKLSRKKAKKKKPAGKKKASKKDKGKKSDSKEDMRT